MKLIVDHDSSQNEFDVALEK